MNWTPYLVLGLAVAVVVVGWYVYEGNWDRKLFSSDPGKVCVNLNANEAARYLREHPETQVLDVRSDGEFAGGALPGAVNVPLGDGAFALNKAFRALETCGKPVATGKRSDEDLIAKQYDGKESLRPIYDAIITKINEFGDDVHIAPKNSYVSLRRNKQFGLIQPSTKTRVDVGLNLGGDVIDGRLEKSGSFNSMVSHRVRLTSVDEVNDALIGWLRQAYEQA